MNDLAFFLKVADNLTPLWLTLVRLLSFSLVFPLLSGRLITALARNAFMFSMAMVVYPMVAAQHPEGLMPVSTLLLVVVKEIFVGALLGYLLGLIFWAIEGMGHMIDFQTGMSMNTLLNPLSGAQSGAMSQFLGQLALALFVASGGLVALMGVLFESYRIWPVHATLPIGGAALQTTVLGHLDGLMALTVKIAFPIVLILIAVELSLGLIGRFAPQLNVYILSQPIKAAVSVLVLALFLAFLYEGARTWLVPTIEMLAPLRS